MAQPINTYKKLTLVTYVGNRICLLCTSVLLAVWNCQFPCTAPYVMPNFVVRWVLRFIADFQTATDQKNGCPNVTLNY
jgi:hypothetical protein